MIILNEYEFIWKIHWPSSVKIRLNGADSQLWDWNLLKEIHAFSAQGGISSSGRTKWHFLIIFRTGSSKHIVLKGIYIWYNRKYWYQHATEVSTLNKCLARITEKKIFSGKPVGTPEVFKFSDPSVINFKWVTPLCMSSY